MAAKAITELLEKTFWEDVDYMIIDFPPGTGDIQLSTVQNLKIRAAIIVTTPQEIAVNDARKATAMFTHKDLNIPVLGIIENMSWFTPEQHPEERYYIFGKGGGKKLAEEFNTQLLGQIPLVAEVGESAELGKSIFNLTNQEVVTSFENIARKIFG